MSLIAPLFLLGLLAFALPWALHRLQQHRAEVVDFPSHQFLESTRSNSARRRKIRFKGLLLLRGLALLALCLLFAEPLWRSSTAGQGDSKRVHYLVLDQSYSMQFGSRWDSAREKISAAISEVSSGDQMQLFGANRELNIMTPLSAEPDELLSQLDAMTPGVERLDYGSLMQQLNSLAEKQRLPVAVTFVTDAQDSATPANFNRLQASALDSFDLVNVATGSDWNLALQASADWINHTAVKVQADVLLSIAGGSAADASREQQPGSSVRRRLVVSAGDRVLGEEMLTLWPGQRQKVDFDNISLERRQGAGALELNVAFEPGFEQVGDDLSTIINGAQDALPGDDQIELLLSQAAPLSVFLYAEEPTRQSVDAVYVNTAFKTALEGQGGVTVEEIDQQARSVPGNADLVVLFRATGASGLDADATTVKASRLPGVLQQYYDDGGKLLVVSGPANSSASSASTNGSTNGEALAGALVPDRVTRIDAAHPLAFDQAGWNDVTIYRPSSMQQWSEESAAWAFGARTVGDGEGPRVLLSSNAGLPVLYELDRRMLVLGLPLDGVSNDLPLSPVFVPFMRNLAAYFLNRNSYPSTVEVGESVRFAASTQVLDPQGDPLFDLTATTTAKTRLLDTEGSYTVVDRNGETLLRVVKSAAESDMKMLDEELIASWGARFEAVKTQNEDGVASAGAGDNDSSASSKTSLPLWQWLLPLFVALGLAELLLSDWILSRFRTGV